MRSVLVILVVCFISHMFAQQINPNGYNTFYNDKGNKTSEGNMKDGLPVGVWRSYYDNGQLKSIGERKGTFADGTWDFFSIKGIKKETINYSAGKKNGLRVLYDSLANKIREENYINDTLVGPFKTYFSNGQLKEVGEFVAGKKSGEVIEYGEDGRVVSRKEFDEGYLKDEVKINRYDANGHKTGLWVSTYPDGTIKNETKYIHGKPDGYSKSYNKSGSLIESVKYQYGNVDTNSNENLVIDLKKVDYDTVQIEGVFRNGLKNGLFKVFKNKEVVGAFEFLKDTLLGYGKLDEIGLKKGEWVYYYPNKKIKYSAAYDSTGKTGKWVYYYSNGKKQQVGKFSKNEPTGSWTYYYKNGQIKRTEFYRKGELNGEVIEYDSLGTEILKANYVRGLREGDWYYNYGDHIEKGVYAMGDRDGTWYEYYTNGKKRFIGTYRDGEPMKKHLYFYENGRLFKKEKYRSGRKHGTWFIYDKNGYVIEKKRFKYDQLIMFNDEAVKEKKEK